MLKYWQVWEFPDAPARHSRLDFRRGIDSAPLQKWVTPDAFEAGPAKHLYRACDAVGSLIRSRERVPDSRIDDSTRDSKLWIAIKLPQHPFVVLGIHGDISIQIADKL